MRGSLALWPEMSRVADTAKAMCLNSVAFERGGYVHKHTHNSLMLKRKQGTGGLNAYHNQTHGQCVCVCQTFAGVSADPLLQPCSPPASQRSKTNMFWKPLAIGCQED